MKKLFSLLFFLLVATSLNAQWVIDSFDHSVNPNTSLVTNWADTSILNTNFFSNGPTAYMDLFNNPADSYDGGGSMLIKYRVEAYDGWGGYNVRTNYHEAGLPNCPIIDLSSGTELSLWYKVNVPADTTQAGTVFCEFKLAQLGDDDARAYFYYQPDFNFFDASGQWLNVRMPLVQTNDKTTGFQHQGGESSDQILHLERIRGIEMAFVYITAGSQTNPPSAEGEVSFDKFQLLGQRYGTIETFDNSASTWGLDWMDWAGADKGALAVSDENTDFVEGTGSLKMDFTLSAPYDWGGFVAVDKEVTVDSMDERTALVLYIKNLVAMAADSGRAFMRIYIFENGDGVEEQWIIDPDVDLSQTFDWTRCYLPLVPKDYLVAGNDRFPPKDGFAHKSGSGDGSIDPNSIFKIRIEPFGRGTADGYAGALKADGSILVDVMHPSGYRINDFEAPVPPVVTVVPGSYSNLVTWADVPGETGEKYYVYASEKPITDLTAVGVEEIGTGIGEDVQVVEHTIVAANTDKEKTYYYAVTCKDFATNISEPGVSGAIVNTAKGIPTVRTLTPNFVADGDLGEWSEITPFHMMVSDGSGKIISTIDDDADLTVDTYVALDNDYLYVAYDIYDDVVNHDPSLDTWLNDCPDLFIGFYNFEKTHRAYQHGSKPDYHLRFNKFLARNDQNESAYDSLLVAGTANYYWGERVFPSGYVVEARIALADLESKRRDETGIIDTISWQKGWQIPFDIGVNDNDGASREGIMYYSHKEIDDGWQNVGAWAKTWIEDDIVGVESTPVLVNKYQLVQNYPNPFNPTTKINYSIEKAGVVKIRVFDILGRQIAELVNQQQNAGSYNVDFNAGNLSSGLYFYSIESGSFKATKKMMLIK